ncbi:hypothetical protein GCM10007425_27980 [Lysinibacillus alkalisoli]|uniref:Leucine-rich repeat domain-containing protein n=1 Tax=Lysinibacillus alkalisoli TaxID=1911548 RepID=A0A917LJ19_9BACI|nr:hypothetical protein [Lysinibacillus alkalisoli]GGG31739.1 hypothetical protein GCM10007425_27980 [Lysinibacillus alkalisoli]
MKIHQMKCPECGGQMQKESANLLQCPFCASKYMIEKEEPYIIEVTQITNHYHYDAPPTKKLVRGGVIGIIIGIILVASMAVVGSGLLTKTLPKEQVEVATRTVPQSGVGIAFVEQVFNKPIAQITTEELASLTYISVRNVERASQWRFDYGFEDYHSETDYQPLTLLIDSDKTLEQLDFTSFTGLQYLHFNDDYELQVDYEKFTLSGLSKLRFYGASFNQPLRQIIEGLAEPTSLVGLEVQLRSEEDVALLAQLPHLTSLKAHIVESNAYDFSLEAMKNYTQLEAISLLTRQGDVSWLTSLSNLTHLSIEMLDGQLQDATLYALPHLESLTLTRQAQLKTIDFVQNMPKLQALHLAHTRVQSLSPLAERTSLLHLTLKHNDALQDLSSIHTLTSLRELDYEGQQTLTATDVGSLPTLQQVTIRTGDLPALHDISQLQSLTLKGSSSFDAAATKVPSVERFALEDVSINEGMLPFTPQQLFVLDSDMDATSFTQLSAQAQQVQLVNSTVYVDQGDITFAPTLQQLTIQNTQPTFVRDGDAISDQAFWAKLQRATSLQQLTVWAQSLDSLDFIVPFASLQSVDFTNNYIKDCAPLLQVPPLQKANLTNNPLTNAGLLRDQVFVIE